MPATALMPAIPAIGKPLSWRRVAALIPPNA